MYLDAANAKQVGPFGYGIRNVKFEPGQLVLFPSWVLHDVKPYEGDAERITVAFNCWFQLQEASSSGMPGG
jgi:predicted 2-oxoglutarate/Fe(II)-dependent dioxygenase YbiX